MDGATATAETPQVVVGSVVTHGLSGPRMTVLQIGPNGIDTECAWFVGAEQHRTFFPLNELALVPPEPAAVAAPAVPATLPVRTHNLVEIDITDLALVRAAVVDARAIGHWRRILAIYGDHLPACAARAGGACDCGWDTAFDD